MAFGIVTLIVGSGRSVALDIDRPIADWIVEAEWIERLAVFDPYGGTAISIGFVCLIGLSGFRCRVMAITYPLAFVAAWVGGSAIRELIDRPRPGSFGDFESYPSGHLIQAVFIAGLVPLALGVLFSDHRLRTISRAVLAVAVVATALHRIHQEDHWPLDALGGGLLGLTVALAAHWMLEHRAWHHKCRSCPWSTHPADPAWRLGVLSFSPRMQRRVGWAGAGGALIAALLLVLATLTIGIPSDPEGSGFGSMISRPVQLGLAAHMGLAGLIAIRFRAVAAVLMALSATGLGLFASVEYRPIIAVTLTAALLIPAVLTWLAWQPEETLGRIAMLATVTTALLTATGSGAVEIHDYYFGPTHTESAAEALDSEADWLWLGAVSSETATVVAGGLDDEAASLHYWPTDEPSLARSVAARP
ncbi:MAG: phosphatase PAP2 family protein, partial [Actinomycetota bacterium]